LQKAQICDHIALQQRGLIAPMSFNEMFAPNGSVRAPYARVEKWLKKLGRDDIERALRESEARFRRQGITFAAQKT
jgi:uncharacterized circularly permuted ATP-grasp superfamily protein